MPTSSGYGSILILLSHLKAKFFFSCLGSYHKLTQCLRMWAFPSVHKVWMHSRSRATKEHGVWLLHELTLEPYFKWTTGEQEHLFHSLKGYAMRHNTYFFLHRARGFFPHFSTRSGYSYHVSKLLKPFLPATNFPWLWLLSPILSACTSQHATRDSGDGKVPLCCSFLVHSLAVIGAL